MVYMLLLKQLLVPPCTTLQSGRVESLPQGKHDMWPWNQEGAESNGNLSSHHESKADVNQPTSAQELYTAGFCGSAFKEQSKQKSNSLTIGHHHLGWQFYSFETVILTWKVLTYRAMIGAHGQSGSWVRAIWFFHWLFCATEELLCEED